MDPQRDASGIRKPAPHSPARRPRTGVGLAHCAAPARLSPCHEPRSPSPAWRQARSQPARSASSSPMYLTARPCAPGAARHESDWGGCRVTAQIRQHTCGQAFLDQPQLLSRRPAPSALRISQNGSRRHVCSLTCQLMSTPSHARKERGRRHHPQRPASPCCGTIPSKTRGES